MCCRTVGECSRATAARVSAARVPAARVPAAWAAGLCGQQADFHRWGFLNVLQQKRSGTPRRLGAGGPQNSLKGNRVQT